MAYGFADKRQSVLTSSISFCPEAKLIIELDGGQHAIRVNQDTRRTKWFEERGYRVVRFWNNDVLSNLEGVLSEIHRVAGPSP